MSTTRSKFDLSKAFTEKSGSEDSRKSLCILTLTLGVCPCTIALTFMSFYAGLYATAAKYNSQWDSHYADFTDVSPYNTCSFAI